VKEQAKNRHSHSRKYITHTTRINQTNQNESYNNVTIKVKAILNIPNKKHKINQKHKI
jgi:hypothetical protein